jgi:hypothetical protein
LSFFIWVFVSRELSDETTPEDDKMIAPENYLVGYGKHPCEGLSNMVSLSLE